MNRFLATRTGGEAITRKLSLPVPVPLHLFLILCLPLLIASNAALAASQINIPLASNFEADGKMVNTTGALILLYFSAPDCRYCMRLEKEVLEPMLRGGDYDSLALLRKIDWRSESQVSDFLGRRISLHQLAERYAVKVTPTLVFVDSSGRELAPRILGFRSADFFWYYLDQRIDQSRFKILGKP